MSADVSVAVVANGTTLEQKLVIGKLGSLPLLISESDISAPAIIIIGKVADQSRLEIMHLSQQIVEPSTNIHQSRDIPIRNNTSEAIL